MTERRDTLDRARELMLMKRWQLPYACFMYAQDLCKDYGMCGETLLTAYAHYANYMEELPCSDEAYACDAQGVQFFNNLCGRKGSIGGEDD